MKLSRYMKQGMLAGLAAGGLALAAAPANAVSLTSAGSLTEGSLTFSNFGCNKTGSGQPATCGGIDVEASTTLPGLTFQGDFADGGWVSGEDFLISYTVTDSGAPITGLDLDFNGTADSDFDWGGWSLSSVTETAYTSPGGKEVGQLTVYCSDPGKCNTGTSQAVLSVGDYTSLYVIKDIQLGNIGLGNETISYIGQSFHTAVPEPMTLALFGTGLFGLGLVQRRRRVV
jgi:hypothetical protein